MRKIEVEEDEDERGIDCVLKREYFLPISTWPEAEREEAFVGLRLLRKQQWT